MSISRARVGLPLDGGSRAGVEAGFKWNEKTRSPKTRLSLSRTTRPTAEAAGPPVQAVPDIAGAPLAFLPFRQFVVLAGLTVVVIFLVLGMVRSNHRALAHSYAISELTLEKVRLLESNRQLKTELAQVSSLTQLEKTARETLGLIVPKEGQIVVID